MARTPAYEEPILTALISELRSRYRDARIEEVYDYRSSAGIVLECLTPAGVYRYLAITWTVPAFFEMSRPLPRRARLAPQPFRQALRSKAMKDLFLTEAGCFVVRFDNNTLLAVELSSPRHGATIVLEEDQGNWRIAAHLGRLSSDFVERATHIEAVDPPGLMDQPHERFFLIMDVDVSGPPRPLRLSALPPLDYEGTDVQTFNSASAAVEALVEATLRRRAFEELKREIEKALRRKLKKLKKLQTNLEADLEEAGRANDYRNFGNLILANVGNNPRGEETLEVVGFDGNPTVVPLDPSKNRVENAEEYFRRARKLEQKGAVAQRRLREARAELELTEDLLARASLANSFKELRELKSMVSPASAEETRSTVQPHRRRTSSKPMDRLLRFRSEDGLEILAGRNAEDNDYLTFRVAKEHDFWFHVAGAPGSHVIVRNPQRLSKCPPRTEEQAAALAAYLSKMRNSTVVLVHTTQRRYLKKAKGGRPGEVIMKTFHSLFVKPSLPVQPTSNFE